MKIFSGVCRAYSKANLSKYRNYFSCDGSTDNSGEICDAFMMQDERVRVFHQENKGAAQAKNMGISVAKGQYITIVDSDDVVKENMIEILYQQVQEKSADIVIGNYYNYDESDENFYFYVTGQDFCVEELSIQEIMNRQAGDWQFNSSAFILPTFKLIKKNYLRKFNFQMAVVSMMKRPCIAFIF